MPISKAKKSKSAPKSKSTKKPKELQKYKEFVKNRLTEITPILQKASVGDFTEKIAIPEKEDEFSELLVGLSLMMDDLQELEKTREKVEEERKERLRELEQWQKLTVGRELKIVELKNQVSVLKQEIENLKNGLGKSPGEPSRESPIN